MEALGVAAYVLKKKIAKILTSNAEVHEYVDTARRDRLKVGHVGHAAVVAVVDEPGADRIARAKSSAINLRPEKKKIFIERPVPLLKFGLYVGTLLGEKTNSNRYEKIKPSKALRNYPMQKVLSS